MEWCRFTKSSFSRILTLWHCDRCHSGYIILYSRTKYKCNAFYVISVVNNNYMIWIILIFIMITTSIIYPIAQHQNTPINNRLSFIYTANQNISNKFVACLFYIAIDIKKGKRRYKYLQHSFFIEKYFLEAMWKNLQDSRYILRKFADSFHSNTHMIS